MSAIYVVPGQLITTEQGYLRGHGCYSGTVPAAAAGDHGKSSGSEAAGDGVMDSVPALVSCMAGRVDRVNKLISVRPRQSRYHGEVGDLVVGRISAVDSRRWKVDLNGQKDAMLQLSSVNLPGGVQRMRTYEDQLQMRTLFTEGDLICAEVQNINSEGMLALHSRSLKYGKLANGQLTIVPAALIKRLPQHYVTLPCGIDVILGRNGFVWVTRSVPDAWRNEDAAANAANADELMPLAETLQRLKLRHENTPLSVEERLNVARVCNCIQIIRIANANSSGSSVRRTNKILSVSPETIMAAYQHSVALQLQPKDLLQQQCIETLIDLLST